MSQPNPFGGTDFGDPHRSFTEREEHSGCKLYGRFIPRSSSGLKSIYQVSVERAEPLTFFVVDCEVSPVKVVHLPQEQLKVEMQEQAFQEARQLLDNGAFNNEERYITPFNY